MSETVYETSLVEKTIATITFDDGFTKVVESNWEKSNGGSDYNGGSWAMYPHFRSEIESRIKELQEWGKAGATVVYERVTCMVQQVERRITKRRFYAERRVEQ